MSLLSRLAVQAARAYGILSSKAGVSASYLVVAGGGSGGVNGGGGGGAGGMLTSTATLSTLNTYSITVGAGGASVSSNISGNNGSNSVISGTGLTTVTSIGGGYGGGAASGVANIPGGTGGSGGGGNGGSTSASSGTSGQGNAGGYGGGSSRYPGGGGGGAGAAGTNGNGGTGAGGNGGNGSASSISGSSVTYAGGGGGGGDPGVSGTGGTGGGGAGVYSGTPNSGTANTGGGGGGQNTAGSTSGAGGSGVVIISYTSATPKFVGGTLTTSGGNQIHTFTSSGTLSPLTPVTASYLVVAGGGGSGSGNSSTGGAGGGAGGLLTSSTTLYSGATYVVTVGAGGAGSPTLTSSASSGGNSVLSGTGLTTVTATGGGYGATYTVNSNNGANGGSGGGSEFSGTAGTGTSGQGYAGGGSTSTSNYGCGGGGGSGGVGATGTTTASGNGGIATASSISGTSTYYAGGGGGGFYSTSGFGLGGGTATVANKGGAGDGSPTGVVGNAGVANTGGGAGGAGGGNTAIGAAGGSGTVIISYAGSQVFNGGLVTSSGGNTIHTFTSTGALTPLTNNLNNSLRFRSSASAYLNRTAGTPTNNKIWTWSGWVKRGQLGTTVAGSMMAAGAVGVPYTEILFSGDVLILAEYNGSSVLQANYTTTQVFRDPSAWYHIVVAVDTTQATAGNRIKMYVNGNQISSFSTSTAYSQNYNTQINGPSIVQNIGRYTGAGDYFDGYMTDINFIDGQALEPYYFGNNDANGVWKPIAYKGTYGTNGFYLTFGNTTSTTTLGYDSSPNGNNWTTNNISLTAGTTYDAMTDVPTNTSATVANYCVNNPVDTSPAGGVNAITISGANLNLAGASSDWAACRATIGVTSGKWYWECTRTGASNLIFGIGLNSTTLVNAYSSTSYGYFSTGDKYSNNVSSAYGASFASGDVIGVAFDADAGTLTFYKNNTSQGTAFTGLTSGPYFPLNQLYTTGSTASINFGQRPFSYTPPTGFVALNTFNLPTPTILQGNKYMDATLWTGNGPASQVIVNQAQFKPDLVWVKNRSSTRKHNLYDSVRGTSKRLVSNDTAAEDTVAGVTAFNSNGMTLGDEGDVNANGLTFVGWQWQAGQGSTSSNTSGSITSTVSVNTTAGFSIVTYTGTGANATVGHGLGVAPKFFIVKRRSAAGNWMTWHTSLTGAGPYLILNSTNAAATGAWNNTLPTSTVFSLLGSDTDENANGSTYVAYCWAEIAGFSSFGSYTGNGSTDGPFIYTGFRPKYVVIKRTDGAGAWYVLDSVRNTYNVMNSYIELQDTAAEGTFTFWDFLSNGFKLRQSASAINGSGQTLIYMAFAENPFKNANAR